MSAAAPAFAPLLQSFFVDRLLRQRNASPATIASYRDTFRLLLRFAESHLHRQAASLTIEDLSAPLVLAFLDHLERERGNTVRTRNVRLAAIHSFASHAAREEPVALEGLRRILAIPAKRFSRPVLGHLSREEMQAILDAPDRSTWSGRRDAVLFATLYNTGARISEALGLDVQSIHLDRTPRADLHGKGRKERTVPLWRSTAATLGKWIQEQSAQPSAPLFPNRHAARLTRSGVARRLALAVGQAANTCPSLRDRDISPHTLRNTTAMHLLESGTDISIIALWLGHESPTTTHTYLEADLALKERALARVDAPRACKGKRFRPSDALLAFLDRL